MMAASGKVTPAVHAAPVRNPGDRGIPHYMIMQCRPKKQRCKLSAELVARPCMRQRFRRYCDELVRLQSLGERSSGYYLSIGVAARCDIDSNHRDDFETTYSTRQRQTSKACNRDGRNCRG